MEEINKKQSEILEFKAYLNSTDYKVTRAFETKTEIDPETLAKRSEARASINILESEITELQKQQDENNSQQDISTELSD